MEGVFLSLMGTVLSVAQCRKLLHVAIKLELQSAVRIYTTPTSNDIVGD